MKNPIQSISIEGFKSIRSLRDFPLNPGLNVLIGANGAGKSNFIELFAIMNFINFGSFPLYVERMGDAETFLFQGAEVTREIAIGLTLTVCPEITYCLDLVPTVKGHFAQRFSVMSLRENPENLDQVRDSFQDFGKDWRVYSFQNTSTFSPMRKDVSIYNAEEFLDDGSNLPAFLYALQEKNSRIYDKIRLSVKQILPTFDDFVLEPREGTNLNDKFVRLRWRQCGSRYLFQPWQMSDGTLRFVALALALLQPEPPTTMLIDEPELGLHPGALNLLAGFMHEAAFQTQLILTTQSPDLLNTMEPEDVITVNMSNGESVFQRLERADLAGWLKEYSIGDLWWKNVIQAGPNYV